MSVSRDLLLELSTQTGLVTMHQQWKARVYADAKTEMLNYMFEDTDQFEIRLKQAIKFVEENGCSIQIGVRRVFFPDEFITGEF